MPEQPLSSTRVICHHPWDTLILADPERAQ